ncbi:hypothetical protein ACOME3_007171 [Neoechinorhynchus agilis]
MHKSRLSQHQEGDNRYCDPPNPCPEDVLSDDCDDSDYSKFTQEYSRRYQRTQDCECDDQHDICQFNEYSKMLAASHLASALKTKSNDVKKAYSVW